MLFDELDKLKRVAIMTSIILMFIGVLLLILPITIFEVFNSLIGFALLVVLVFSILSFISSKKVLISYIKLVGGLVCGTLGFVFLIFDTFLISILYLLVGIIPIVSGIYGIVHALLFARTSGRKGWWVLIILAVALMAFGTLQFINPWMETAEGFLKVIGGVLMASSIISALRLIWIWPIKSNN